MRTPGTVTALLSAQFPGKSPYEIKAQSKENIRGWQVEIWALKDSIQNLERVIDKLEHLIKLENDWIDLVEYINEHKPDFAR